MAPQFWRTTVELLPQERMTACLAKSGILLVCRLSATYIFIKSGHPAMMWTRPNSCCHTPVGIWLVESLHAVESYVVVFVKVFSHNPDVNCELGYKETNRHVTSTHTANVRSSQRFGGANMNLPWFQVCKLSSAPMSLPHGL